MTFAQEIFLSYLNAVMEKAHLVRRKGRIYQERAHAYNRAAVRKAYNELIAKHDEIFSNPLRAIDFQNPYELRRLATWQQTALVGLHSAIKSKLRVVKSVKREAITNLLEDARRGLDAAADVLAREIYHVAAMTQDEALMSLHSAIEYFQREAAA